MLVWLMAGISHFLGNAIIDWYRGTTFPAAPASVFIRVYSAMPADDGTGGTELSGSGYSALEIEGATGLNFSAGALGLTDNDQLWQVGVTATADWATAVGIAFWSLATGGTMYSSHALGTPRTVKNGETFTFAAGDLDLDTAGV